MIPNDFIDILITLLVKPSDYMDILITLLVIPRVFYIDNITGVARHGVAVVVGVETSSLETVWWSRPVVFIQTRFIPAQKLVKGQGL